jgi:hypothetical protein
MSSVTPNSGHGLTRRGFLLGAAAGLATGAPLAWFGARNLSADFSSCFAAHSQEVPNPAYAMPGRFPGRVVEVHHPGSVNADYAINSDAVNLMMDRGMTTLTGAEHPVEAWRSFFERGDVVGIKVNPVGRAPKAGERNRVANAHGAISSPEVLLKIVDGLKSAGVEAKNIIVFERYAEEFVEAGYEDVMRTRPMDGVRWFASAVRYSEQQVDIQGFDEGREACSPEMARHVVGYDPDVFVHMGFCNPQHHPRDDRRYRTHLSVIVSRLVNKLITIPVLKDHRSAGVTLALKNLSHGLNNNVARSHLPVTLHGGKVGHEYAAGPNQCNTFIPTAVSQPLTRQKATLHILDGLVGVYEGGPHNRNKTWGTWRYQGLFFATDPVALDHVGWDIIDAKRVEEGWAPVANMGLRGTTPHTVVSTGLAPLGAPGLAELTSLAVTARNRQDGRATEVFDLRQPEHVLLAGTQGLGVFDANGIDLRRVDC